MSLVARLARSPLLHFVALGGILFVARPSFWRAEGEPLKQRQSRIVLSADQVGGLEESFAARWGRNPDEAERRALVEQAVLDEMLYREARFLSLDLEDGSVQRRLVEKMRAVSDHPGRPAAELVREATSLGLEDDVVIRRLLAEKMRMVLQQGPGGTPIGDSDLRANLERRREELEQPATVTLTQVFLGADSHGVLLQSDAEQTLARLRAVAHTDEQAAALSDPFPLGTTFRSYSQLQLQARFGKSFGEQVFALPSGAWSEPIVSPYGVHLVRVEAKQEARLPPLEEVRPALTRAVLRERAQQSLARGLARLRTLYQVEIVDGAQSVDQAQRHDEGFAAKASG